MQAIEFQTTFQTGGLKVPGHYANFEGKPVTVIVLRQEEEDMTMPITSQLAEYPPPISTADDWRAKLARATQIRTQIAARVANQPLPAAVELIKQAREERDEQFSNLC